VLFAASAVLSLALTPLVARVAWRLGAVDLPAARKLHRAPVPRLGGVAVALAAALTTAGSMAADLFLGTPLAVDLRVWAALLIGGGCVLAVGIRDDVRPVAPLTKLAAEIAAAAAVVLMGVRVENVTLFGTTSWLGPLTIPVTLAWIVLLTNAFNLMDGLDGLATGLAIIAALTSGTLLIARGDTQGALVMAVLLGALCGFLPYNVGPATIFLGDSGSLLVGYALAVTAITGVQKSATTLTVAVPLLIFALPIAETVMSAARRFLTPTAAASGRPLSDVGRRLHHVLEADRAHIHHRLLDRGLSQRSVVLLLYAVSGLLSLLALATATLP
jgi:UDP-GlcNAc:undecaprenyl-phosphate GlcNAc-1-phosphate transferase